MELVQQTKQEWQAVQEQRKRQYTTVDQSLQQLIDKVQENLREISTTGTCSLLYPLTWARSFQSQEQH